MIKRVIELPTVGAVKDFVGIMSRCPANSDIKAERFTVDARSLMGIFSLDLSKPVELNIDADEDDIEDTLAAVKKFTVD